MGTLSDRLAFLLSEWGSDAAARQSELHALDALEARDPNAAVARFHELKRAWAEQRRADLLRRLREHAFVRDVPPADATGMTQREVEREIGWAAAALQHARAADEALREAEAHLASLRSRRAPADLPDAGSAPWTELRVVAERAEARRRAAAREARVEARAADAARRAGRLKARLVDVPDVSSDAVPDADAASDLLDAAEARLSAEEAVEDAHRAVAAALRDASLREYRARSRKQLDAEAARAVAAEDPAEAARALRDLLPRVEALRAEAARDASQAARARRSGRPPPRGEARPGDAMDPYA